MGIFLHVGTSAVARSISARSLWAYALQVLASARMEVLPNLQAQRTPSNSALRNSEQHASSAQHASSKSSCIAGGAARTAAASPAPAAGRLRAPFGQAQQHLVQRWRGRAARCAAPSPRRLLPAEIRHRARPNRNDGAAAANRTASRTRPDTGSGPTMSNRTVQARTYPFDRKSVGLALQSRFGIVHAQSERRRGSSKWTASSVRPDERFSRTRRVHPAARSAAQRYRPCGG